MHAAYDAFAHWYREASLLEALLKAVPVSVACQVADQIDILGRANALKGERVCDEQGNRAPSDEHNFASNIVTESRGDCLLHSGQLLADHGG